MNHIVVQIWRRQPESVVGSSCSWVPVFMAATASEACEPATLSEADMVRLREEAGAAAEGKQLTLLRHWLAA